MANSLSCNVIRMVVANFWQEKVQFIYSLLNFVNALITDLSLSIFLEIGKCNLKFTASMFKRMLAVAVIKLFIKRCPCLLFYGVE